MKAIGLFSGGLDSILAVRIIQELSVEVVGLHIVTPFFQYGEDDIPSEQRKTAEELGISIILHFVGEDYIEMLKNPEHGYGSQINPCIDCHIHFFRIAREVMSREDAGFVFTGEVLGERPMSQNKKALRTIEVESGLSGLLLRPLSAKLLKPTIPEEKGLIDRERLYDIQGRGRKRQFELAEKFGIDFYPTPGGGCLLTEPNFAPRVRDALKHGEESLLDMNLLRYGRHFRLTSGARAVVGRDEEDNLLITGHFTEGDYLIDPTSAPGPTVLLRNKKSEDDLSQALSLCAYYSKGEGPYTCEVKTMGDVRVVDKVMSCDDSFVDGHMIR